MTLAVDDASRGFDERRTLGRDARSRYPRSRHADALRSDRADPVAVLEQQNTSRVEELVPIRFGRMLVSPLTFYRGAAVLMAADLASGPNSELNVQLCGDAHLSNFGLFATPERRLVFDINDFDETHPGPFEWDVKRLAASFEVAGRSRGFSDAERREIALSAVRGYREQMLRAAAAPVLESWYDRVDVKQQIRWLRAEQKSQRVDAADVNRTKRTIAKARTRDSMRAFTKLVGTVDGHLRITADPPLIVPVGDLIPTGHDYENDENVMRKLLSGYRRTLQGTRHPLDEFTYVHMARKVVGVGSVGTRAWIILLQGRDAKDPLLLQAKEAHESVLEPYLGASHFNNHGERVVRGQRLLQFAGDVFLGWQRVTGVDGVSRDYYVRQLQDWKGSADVDHMRAAVAPMYARLCGRTLARAHVRSGDRVAIAAYLGKADTFDRAIADFSAAYADQNDRDYRALREAASAGRVDVVAGL